MSYVKSVPLKKLFQYTQDDDEVVLLASTNEQPEDAAQLADALSGEISVDNAAVVTALGGTPADDVTLEPEGGANKIPQFDANGNLKLAPLRNLADTGLLNVNGGNLILTDRQMVGWYAADSPESGSPTGDGKMLFRIRQDNGHPYETNIDAAGNICFYWGNSTSQQGMQLGNALGGNHFIYLQAGTATAESQQKPSVPIAFRTKYWNGSASVSGNIVAQGVALDTAGTSALRFYRNPTVLGTSDTMDGDIIAEMTSGGIWTEGVAPTPDALTDGTTITQTCSKYKNIQAAKVTLEGNRTLKITGLVAGMRGVIFVTQDGTGSRTLTPSGGTALDLSTASAGVTDRVIWEYDGIYTNFAVQKNVQQQVIINDDDAAAFITAASLTDATQKSAVEALVTSLKASNVDGNGTLWSKFYAMYPFVGGSAAAHVVDLKGAYSSGSFGGTVSHTDHASGTITGDGVSGYFDCGFNPNSQDTLNSLGLYVYCRTQSPTASGYFCGALDAAVERAGLYNSSGSLGLMGLNANSVAGAGAAGSDFRKHLAVFRTSGSEQTIYCNGTSTAANLAATGKVDQSMYFLARRSSTTTSLWSNANLGFAAITQGLTSTEYAAFRAIVDAFQTALGRANP